jgi:hypothetical protein
MLNGRQMPGSSLRIPGASRLAFVRLRESCLEAVAGVEIYKTNRAATPTGGIGASINIKTHDLSTRRDCIPASASRP